MVKGNKGVRTIIKSNFSGWVCNYKVYIVGILLLTFAIYNFSSVFELAKAKGYRVPPYLFPFLFTQPFMRLLIFTCIVLAFSNAPFANSLQLLMVARVGKRHWFKAQMLYVALCSVILTLFLIIVPVLANIRMIVLQGNWGKVLFTAPHEHDLDIPIVSRIVAHYKVGEAMEYSILVFFLLVLFIGMVLFFCNTIGRNQSTGVCIIVGLILLDWLYHLSERHYITWFSPISWSNLSYMAYGRDISVPPRLYAIIALLIMNSMLVVATYLMSKKKDLNFLETEN